eukprot:4866854-Amphidinium_carterae.1
MSQDSVDDPLGLRLDLLSPEHPLVCSVEAGIIEDYNAKAERKVQENDFIVSVNGCKGGSTIATVLKHATRLDFLVRRGIVFTVNVQKEDGKLGVEFMHEHEGFTLLVLAVVDGPVAKYNSRADLARCIQSQDHVVRVNACAGKPQAMLEELRQADSLSITICRAPEKAELAGGTKRGVKPLYLRVACSLGQV